MSTECTLKRSQLHNVIYTAFLEGSNTKDDIKKIIKNICKDEVKQKERIKDVR